MVTSSQPSTRKDSNVTSVATELGQLPADWSVRLLPELCERITVGIATSATHAYRTNGVPLFRNQDIKASGLRTDDLLFVDEQYEVRFRNKRLKSGDLLIARTGYPGTAAVVPEAFDGAQCFTTLIASPRSSEVLSEYLSAYLNSEAGQRFFDDNKIGGGQKNIGVGILRRCLVPVPASLAEQAAISEALSDADKQISMLEHYIAKKRAIKQGAMQDLLSGHKRLPGFSGAWAIKPLGEICQVLNGLTYSPSDVRQSGTLVLRSSNIQDDALSFENNVFVEMTLPPNVLVEENDILVCVRNGSRELIGKCAKITSDVKGAAFGAFMAVLRSPLHSYLLHQFRSGLIKRQIAEHLGATINQITNKSLKSFSVSVPNTIAEADAIALTLSDMEGEIDRLSTKLSKARLLKQGMAQELLTGRVRLV